MADPSLRVRGVDNERQGGEGVFSGTFSSSRLDELLKVLPDPHEQLGVFITELEFQPPSETQFVHITSALETCSTEFARILVDLLKSRHEGEGYRPIHTRPSQSMNEE